MGDSSCNSHHFGRVEGTLCAVGKSLGVNSLSQVFLTVGEAQGVDEEPALGCCPCWYRPSVRFTTLCVALIGGH